jgi:hypothetical protein
MAPTQPGLQPETPDTPETPDPAIARRHGLLLLLCLAVVFAARGLEIRDGREVSVPGWTGSLPELCHSRRWLDISCPGCGLTRGLIALAHGRLEEAWSYNPGSIPLWGLILFQIPHRSWKLWRWKRRRLTDEPGRIMGGIWIAITLILLAQWCWRWRG